MTFAVFESEGLEADALEQPKMPPMPRLSGVVVTPLSAFGTRKAAYRTIRNTAGNVAAFLAGTPRNDIT